MRRWPLHVVVIAALAPASAVWAQDGAAQAEIDALKETVQQLIEANEALRGRVDELERRLDNTPDSPSPKPEAPAAEESVEQAKEDAEAETAGESQEHNLRVFWRNGLRFESPDEAFKLKIGGRIAVDAGAFKAPDYWHLGGPTIDENDGAEFRQARLGMEGTLDERYLFELEAEFAGDAVELKGASIGVDGLPGVGLLRVGQFKVPFGLESQTSTRFITFMEPAMSTAAFAPDRALGLGVANSFFDARLSAALGGFYRDIEDKGFWSFAARLCGAPWYAKDGRFVFHLGASYVHETPNGEIALHTHPEAHLANEHLHTGYFPANTLQRWGFESALILGPVSLQGEYMAAEAELDAPHRPFSILDFDSHFASGRRFSGYYVQASWFVTGESRAYVKRGGYFGRLIPKRPFKVNFSAPGAWEIAVRYSSVDLNDFDVRSGIVGGEGRNWTAGVNWHLTPNLRASFNYLRAHIDQVLYDGAMDVFQGRFQVDF